MYNNNILEFHIKNKIVTTIWDNTDSREFAIDFPYFIRSEDTLDCVNNNKFEQYYETLDKWLYNHT